VRILSWSGDMCALRRAADSIPVLDYVFVDEHNRHKRLKGMSPWDSLALYLANRAC
jgi:hypothetical protein